jgi:thiol-disulfide isomerase/thioredoxin
MAPRQFNLVVFWATTCGLCREEQPKLAKLHRTYATAGLRVITVAMPYDPPNQVLQYVRMQRIEYPVALDLRGELMQTFKVMGTPTTFLIDSSGTIEKTIVGKINYDDLSRQIADKLTIADPL